MLQTFAGRTRAGQRYAVRTIGDDLHDQLVAHLLDVAPGVGIELFEGGAVVHGEDPAGMRIVTVDPWALAARFERPADLDIAALVDLIQDHITEGMIAALTKLGAEEWPVGVADDGTDSFELRVAGFEALTETIVVRS